MRKIYASLGIGISNASQNDELEVDDDATDEEIDEAVRDWANNYIDYGWSDKP